MAWNPGARTRHLLITAALIIAVGATLTVVAITRVINIHLAARQASVKLISDQIFSFAQEAILQNPSPSADEFTRQQSAREAIRSNENVRRLLHSSTGSNGEFVYFAIISPEGETIIEEDPQKVRSQMQRIRPIEEFEGARKDKQWFALRHSERLYQFTREISMSEKPFGKIIAGVSARSMSADLQPPFRLLMIVGLITIGLALLIAVVTSNLVLRPLRELMKSIEQLEAESAPDASITVPEAPIQKIDSGTASGTDANSVTQRLRVLGKRFAGNRLEMENLRDQLRQVVSNVSEPVVLLDRERRVLMASPEAEKLLGNYHLGLRGKVISDALGIEHPLNRLTQRAFNERKSLQETTALIANGDQPQMVVASVQLFEEQERPAGALVTLRDFESLRQLETQLDSTTRIAALSRITSGIAHEIRNPLNAMVLHLELLETKLQSGASPQTHVQVLKSEIPRLNRVVQTFLDFTRPVEPRLITTDANALVREVMLLAAHAHGEGVEIVERYAEGPLYLKADSDLLKQAILNIVINGCQAMPDGGRLIVSTEREATKSIVISIRDEGPGISPEVREKIFNLYYTTKPNGTGIGLALTFRAVQLHNARIEVESEPGQGAYFKITLPPG
jgi:PAS domain S-box-containing protein